MFDLPEIIVLILRKISIILTNEIIGTIFKIYFKKLKIVQDDISPSNFNL